MNDVTFSCGGKADIFMERIGHLISWILLLAVPVAAPLSVAGWLPQPFGNLGAISDAFLLIVSAVFVHGIIQAASEPGTGI